MKSSSANRDLLFGLLALQNNFIDRDALVDAFHRWTGDRSNPLDRVLLDRGALTPGRHMLLAGLVEEHIKFHGDDPERSLAALSSIGPVREDLSRIADPDLHASLAHVSAARKEPEDDPYRTVTQASLGESTSAGSRFRILRPHARGGLGRVSVALDQELDRPVALKEIQDRHADEPESRARFVQEAEITGKLEHPGIIPVYGLGHDATGRPFYAMRFIEGDSLKEAIAAFHGDESLRKDPAGWLARLRELLRRFTDVCNSVAYAHSRGVLHRDLKPGNIMLGPYGETLVVDWGLAKPLGRALAAELSPGDGSPLSVGPIRLSGPSSSRDETATGSIVGTPAYASPEQVVGRFDQLGPASDVYGLGATLYTLLTGQTPVPSGEIEEILRRVQRGEIPPPRSLESTIPRPIEAICRKAMAVRPEDRYPSARDLAADVTRWLDDQPVAAYHEPLSVRAGRWVRRHRTLVTTAAAVSVFGVIGLSGFATVLTGKNRELDARNLILAQKYRELDQQKERAEERESLAIEAVKKFRDAITSNPDLKIRPELEALRKALLKEPLEFLHKLRDQLQADRDTRLDALAKLAGANFDLARTTEEIGSIPDAMRSYSEAIAIFGRLGNDHPRVTEYQRDLAKSHNNIGSMLSATGRQAEALASHRRALEIRERLAADDPKNPEFQDHLAGSHHNIGQILAMDHPAEALESYRRALAIWERLARENPAVTQYQSRLALSHHYIGNLRGTGHPIEALESYRRALAIWERLARENSAVTEFQRDLAFSHQGIGQLLSATGHATEALASFRQALGAFEHLAGDYPSVTKFQSALAGNHSDIAKLLHERGHPTEAIESYRRALAIWERLARDNAAVIQYPRSLAVSHSNLGALLSETGHPTEALGSYQEALAIWERLVRENPSSTRFQGDLASSLNNLANLLHETGHPTEAIESYRRALVIQERLVRENPSVTEYQSDLGLTLHNMAEIEMGQRRWQEALGKLGRAITHQRAALAAEPRRPFYQQLLKLHLLNLAKVQQALNQPAEAIRAARELAALARGNPNDLYNVVCAISSTVPLTNGEQQQSLVAEAVGTLKQAISAGWNDALHTSRDPDLIPLRDRDDFRRLLAEMFDRGFPDDPFAR
jgi:eukaryotic-like serine/threonine-protein kinase